MRITTKYQWSQLGGALLVCLSLGACSTGPTPQAQSQYPEPIFSAERVLPQGMEPGPSDVYDPWEGMNKRIYNFNYHFDNMIFLPVVRGYRWIMPDFAEKGIHNFFNNFRDLRTLANSILQLSPDKTAQAAGRVMVNTTVGLFGLVDVATTMGLPRPFEDFGQTLGHYGVGQGPFLVIPLLGPSNLRDGIGLLPDAYMTSAVQDEVLSKPLRRSAFLLDAIDTRANVNFHYYENGLAFEYDYVRWLWSTKREIDVAK